MKEFLIWLKENNWYVNKKEDKWYTTNEKNYILNKPRKYYTEEEVINIYKKSNNGN